jgi:DNA mismatch repair ATPase MutS
LAGLPEAVLKRAEDVLATLESHHELPTPDREAIRSRVVNPPEGPPRRKHKLRPQIAGPTLFGEPDAGSAS